MKKGLITKLMASLSAVMASLAVVVTSGLTNSTCYLFCISRNYRKVQKNYVVNKGEKTC